MQNRVTVGVPVALARRLQHATLQRATMGSSSMDSATSSASESSPSQKRDESQPLLHSPAGHNEWEFHLHLGVLRELQC